MILPHNGQQSHLSRMDGVFRPGQGQIRQPAECAGANVDQIKSIRKLGANVIDIGMHIASGDPAEGRALPGFPDHLVRDIKAEAIAGVQVLDR